MEKYLFLFINVISISIPLIYSFIEKRFNFYKNFHIFIFSTIVVSIPFLVWDYFFIYNKIWGFNKNYCIGLYIYEIPIERYLFFFCIPYASIFLHESLVFYIKNWKINSSTVSDICLVLKVFSATTIIINFNKLYTVINFSLFFIVIFIASYYYKNFLSFFLPSFLVILIPFLIVNGVITGWGIEEPIIWYNNSENLGLKIGTIPIEDIFYTFSLLFSIKVFFYKLKKIL